MQPHAGCGWRQWARAGGRRSRTFEHPENHGQTSVGWATRQNKTYAELGKVEPHDEDRLERKVPGDVVEHDAEREALSKVEEGEDDPVGEVLSVVLVSRGLDGTEGEEAGDDKTDEVRDGHGEGVDRVEDEDECGTADDEVRLGHIRALLSLVERGVLGELRVIVWASLSSDRAQRDTHLLVELGHVVVRLVLGCQVSRVGLNLLLGRLGGHLRPPVYQCLSPNTRSQWSSP
jgi:hypothetical protein